MDTITHIALGACIGEAFFEKGFGKKAMIWGALAQSIPDIDFIASGWLSTADSLLAHRGITHSLLFSVLAAPAFAITAFLLHRKQQAGFYKWLLFFAVEIWVHLFIDGFNNYGIGWLEPFSHHRFSFNAIYVADPLFSIWPGIALLVLIRLNRFSERRKFWWRLGIVMPFLYLGYCSINKIRIDQDVEYAFKKQAVMPTRYFTTPAPLQNWLWFVVAQNDSGYDVAYRSVFDEKAHIDFHHFPRADSLMQEAEDKALLQKLIHFSKGFYTLEKWHDTLVFNDLRFGQTIGWKDPTEHFAFHFFLNYPSSNKLVVQRGRFAKWDWNATKLFAERIKGN